MEKKKNVKEEKIGDSIKSIFHDVFPNHDKIKHSFFLLVIILVALFLALVGTDFLFRLIVFIALFWIYRILKKIYKQLSAT